MKGMAAIGMVAIHPFFYFGHASLMTLLIDIVIFPVFIFCYSVVLFKAQTFGKFLYRTFEMLVFAICLETIVYLISGHHFENVLFYFAVISIVVPVSWFIGSKIGWDNLLIVLVCIVFAAEFMVENYDLYEWKTRISYLPSCVSGMIFVIMKKFVENDDERITLSFVLSLWIALTSFIIMEETIPAMLVVVSCLPLALYWIVNDMDDNIPARKTITMIGRHVLSIYFVNSMLIAWIGSKDTFHTFNFVAFFVNNKALHDLLILSPICFVPVLIMEFLPKFNLYKREQDVFMKIMNQK
ncbi:MAG: hypothetical protein D6732_17295 [Methanobacteriota archaeon]|nr:MAG: hypothetical protein D6732_17295 [Euryarchaeota archaeon]